MSPERLSFDISRYCHDKTNLAYPKHGMDAVFYLDSNTKSGIKVYTTIGDLLGLNEAEAVLEEYKNLTNYAHELAIYEDWKIKLGDKEMNIRVNPYTELVRCEEHGVCVGRMPILWGNSLLISDVPQGFVKGLEDFLKLKLKNDSVDISRANLFTETGDLVIADLCGSIFNYRLGQFV